MQSKPACYDSDVSQWRQEQNSTYQFVGDGNFYQKELQYLVFWVREVMLAAWKLRERGYFTAHLPGYGVHDACRYCPVSLLYPILKLSKYTIYTAGVSLQGKEVRRKFDSSFADIYHDLDMQTGQ